MVKILQIIKSGISINYTIHKTYRIRGAWNLFSKTKNMHIFQDSKAEILVDSSVSLFKLPRGFDRDHYETYYIPNKQA